MSSTRIINDSCTPSCSSSSASENRLQSAAEEASIGGYDAGSDSDKAPASAHQLIQGTASGRKGQDCHVMFKSSCNEEAGGDMASGSRDNLIENARRESYISNVSVVDGASDEKHVKFEEYTDEKTPPAFSLVLFSLVPFNPLGFLSHYITVALDTMFY